MSWSCELWIFSFSSVNFFHWSADVDVNEPDEKSLITYVSSLYDVFPEVPTVEQSLRDNVSIWVLNNNDENYMAYDYDRRDSCDGRSIANWHKICSNGYRMPPL